MSDEKITTPFKIVLQIDADNNLGNMELYNMNLAFIFEIL